MSNLIKELSDRKLIQPPSWLPTNIVYLTITGSVSYGCEDTKANSDFDVYGVCIPPKDQVFPHFAGLIPLFDDFNFFEQYQQHHIFDASALGGRGREYDFTVYNIVKYFKLLMENNPNIIDTLFTSHECVLSISQVGNLLRENRKTFLHKGCWAKFKGYSYSQMHKMDIKTPKDSSKRADLIEKHGFDVKYAMHIVRLLLEVEQILQEGDLDLKRNKEQLKSIRRGEWTINEIKDWADKKEKHLESLYEKSDLPAKADKNKIRNLLIDCLEIHYGSLDKLVVQSDKASFLLRSIKEQIEKAGI
jgi:predicted nucleotidyltransferase